MAIMDTIETAASVAAMAAARKRTMRKVKKIIYGILTGATVAIALLMVFVAYSDHLDPRQFPLLACAGLLFPVFLAADVVLLIAWVALSWKRAWVPLLPLLVSWPAVRAYVPLHLSEQPPVGSIKVVSYNVACYTVDSICPSPPNAIRDYLLRQDADIVCLQEDVIAGKDSTAALSTVYPYNDTVHVNKPSSPVINAVGIHTRYPILRKERIAYTSDANGTAAFFLLVDDDTLIVVNNHLESNHLNVTDRRRYTEMIEGGMNGDDAKAETRHLVGKLRTAMVKRATQADIVRQWVDEHSDYPVIMCGDFNDTPISYTRREMSRGLTDCFVASGTGLGISFNKKGFPFRIDHILCSAHFKPYSCYVDADIKASDHYPIVTWLKRQ